MNNTLFPDTPEHPPYQPGSETSHEAADRIKSITAKMKYNVMVTYASFGKDGATREEVAHAGGYQGSTVRPRTIELLRMGALEPTGEKRPTRSGNPAQLLRATTQGRAMLELTAGQGWSQNGE